jgi:hypothetical protein
METMTIGIVAVAHWAAWPAGGAMATMTSTLRWTSSEARIGSRCHSIVRWLLKDDVLPLDIAEFSESLANHIEVCTHRWSFERAAGYQETHLRDFRHLLRVCRERPSRRATDKGNEVPPFHEILRAEQQSVSVEL